MDETHKCSYRFSKDKLTAEKSWTESGDSGVNNSSTRPDPTYEKLSD